MIDQKKITQLLRDDADRFARQYERAGLDADLNIDSRMSQRLRRVQHRRNFMITVIAVFSAFACALFLLTQDHRTQEDAAAVFALAAFGFIAIFTLIHDPDY